MQGRQAEQRRAARRRSVLRPLGAGAHQSGIAEAAQRQGQTAAVVLSAGLGHGEDLAVDRGDGQRHGGGLGVAVRIAASPPTEGAPSVSRDGMAMSWSTLST